MAEGCFLFAVGIFNRKVECGGVEVGNLDCPTVGRYSKSLLQSYEIFKVFFRQRIGFAKVAVEVELVIPNLFGGAAFVEKQHHGFYARTRKHARRKVENGVEVAGFEKFLAGVFTGAGVKTVVLFLRPHR